MIYCFEAGREQHTVKHGEGEGMRALAHFSQVRLLNKHKGHIEVCSVSMLDQDLEKPDDVLEYMVKLKSEPDVGGFRQMNEQEFVALVLGSYRNKALDEQYMNLFQLHPYTRAGGLFPFIAGASEWLFTFINFIYDIRRFYDRRLRKQNLQREFGLLTPDNLTRFFKAQTADPTTLRPMVTFQAWAVSPMSDLTVDQADALPEAFLQRERIRFFAEARKTNDEERAKQLAFWQTTVRFLKFVELLWIDGLGGVKFDPDRFFLRHDEADSFRAFIKQPDLKG